MARAPPPAPPPTRAPFSPALYEAAASGQMNTLRQLLEDAAIRKSINVGNPDEGGAGPLHAACFNNHPDAVDLLVANGAFVDKCNGQGETPLHLGSGVGSRVVEVLLLKHNADPTKQDANGLTPLCTALLNSNFPAARLLSGAGSTIPKSLWDYISENVTDKKQLEPYKSCVVDESPEGGPGISEATSTALHSAASRGDAAAMRELLKVSKDDIEKVDAYGQTPLRIACARGFADVADVILDVGKADPNSAHKETGATPLYLASSEGNLAVVKTLLHYRNRHLDVNKPDETGRTPLYAACDKGHLDVVKLLIKAGEATADSESNDGVTPLIAAIAGKHQKIAEVLVNKAGADASKGEGTSALHAACQYGLGEIVQLLLDKGRADVNKLDLNGATALVVALQCGEFASAKILADAGSTIPEKFWKELEEDEREEMQPYKCFIPHPEDDDDIDDGDGDDVPPPESETKNEQSSTAPVPDTAQTETIPPPDCDNVPPPVAAPDEPLAPPPHSTQMEEIPPPAAQVTPPTADILPPPADITPQHELAAVATPPVIIEHAKITAPMPQTSASPTGDVSPAKSNQEIASQQQKSDPSPLSSNYKLEVTVRGCSHLKVGSNGKADFYVTIVTSEGKTRTKVASGTSEPAFNETFVVPVYDPAKDAVMFEVWASDHTNDELLAYGGFLVNGLKNKEAVNKDVKLREGPKSEGFKHSGRVSITAKALDFTKAGWRTASLSPYSGKLPLGYTLTSKKDLIASQPGQHRRQRSQSSKQPK